MVAAILSDPGRAEETLGITSDYEILGAVVSFNWIGTATVQEPTIPIISLQHLLDKLKVAPDFQSVTNWLNERRYLPIQGKDFTYEPQRHKIGDWEAEWYGFRLMREDLPDP